MKLAVFDLDGTLTATNAVDDAYFVRALRIVFDIDLINTNWTAYSHVTDASVMAVAFGEKHDRGPEPAEISRFIECFVALLNEECPNRPDLFGEIPGAVAFLAAIRQHSEWRAAIATGGRERSARFKMMASQIDADGMPAAFAEDGPARETIVEAAIIRACAAYATSTFEKIVLVGDAVWDVRTAWIAIRRRRKRRQPSTSFQAPEVAHTHRQTIAGGADLRQFLSHLPWLLKAHSSFKPFT